jgi:DNA-binding NarL/FixJ family response regulator
MSENEAFVLEALKNGATAYVLKGCKTEFLMQGLRLAAAGQSYLSPPFSDHPIETYLEKARSEAHDVHDTLTPREREVLQLAAEGNTNAEIAARLFLSSRTVEMHRSSMMRKLGLRNQTDLVRYAIKRGLLPSDQ